MEIQGLSDAQNNHSQHGALHGSTFSELSTKSTPRSEFISAKTEVGGLCEPRTDNNNNRRPTTVPFCSRPENGSTMDFSPPGEPEPPDKRLFVGNTCSNVNFKKQSGTQLSPEASLSCGAGAERQEKMALPGSEEMPLSSAALRTENLLSSAQHPDCDYKDLQQLYVVFTVTPNKDNIGAGLSSAGVSEETCVSAAALDKDRDHTRYSRSMEDENSGTDVFSEDRGDRSLPETHTLDINDQSFCLPDQSFNTKLPDYHKTVEDIFSRKCFDKLPALSSADMSVSKVPVNSLDEGSALVSVDSCLMETANSPDGITVCGGLQDSANPVTMPPGSSTESFSGTIMINNQSIIVTIDNGLVTLSTPPEGYPHKEDDLVSLKEHLGMKDYEDVVLLNYDGGTKAIGKINTLTASSSSQIKDSELPLMEDCSTMYSFTEADLISPSPKAAVFNVDNEEAQSPIKSKKEIIAFYDCPESGCSATFLSRRKLKVHLLNHAEDKRPFQCTVEGCGWAFTTSYKLKRHIQSHDKQRPFECTVEGCDRRFTTVYNLKAHVKNHKQDDAFACDLCSERFRSATRLASHQRVHFEPQRNHKCEFPGCEKTFMTFSAMFSHNRSHFRESGHFVCSFPGCEKTYDKACRLKIHLRSHTGERPFVCDSGGCGWSFTSMSKLLRHKRKHDDDRRFVCTEEGCGKSFTRAEHLKGHSITHLGTKPFQCHAEGCNAKFSARSSLYIHSKKHKQDASSLRTRCPVDNCIKHFSSRSSLKSHMLKCHHISPDMLSQMEMTPTLTPSSELVSPSPALIPGAGPSGDQMTSLDLSSLLSGVAASTVPTAGINVGIPVGGTSSSGMFTMDLSMVNSGILTIDPSSVGALSSAPATALAKTVDPLLLTTATEVGSHEALERSVEEVLPPQGTLNLDDVQSVTPEALGSLSGLSMQSTGVTVDALSVESTAPVVELLASLPKGPEVPVPGQGSLLSCVEVMETQEGEKVLTQFVFPAPNSTFSPQKDSEHSTVSCSFLESGGSARTDYRAIQLAKKRKQSAPASGKRGKFVKAAAGPLTGAQFGESTMSSNTALNLRDVHIQLLQDDPASDGDLAFQLSSQPSSSHTQLTVDLPVNILQEPSGMPEDDTGSENSQFTGSTINLQDLE